MTRVLFRGCEHDCEGEKTHLYYRVGSPTEPNLDQLAELGLPTNLTFETSEAAYLPGEEPKEGSEREWEVTFIPTCIQRSLETIGPRERAHWIEGAFDRVFSQGQQEYRKQNWMETWEKEEETHSGQAVILPGFDTMPRLWRLDPSQRLVTLGVSDFFAEELWPIIMKELSTAQVRQEIVLNRDGLKGKMYLLVINSDQVFQRSIGNTGDFHLALSDLSGKPVISFHGANHKGESHIHLEVPLVSSSAKRFERAREKVRKDCESARRSDPIVRLLPTLFSQS